ncbi:hypothetical protein DAEQUDRAFT_726885 [Daedalea quercina L-15889]|uniref:Uncharacterized protein n=1 Tax=Daedalea quercina L-15889 TaxID=1314783 RepID=A0A165QD66_9APHY|nr:hypothetical protein DAEQUDRAFT_726885 [Daedalea quercina L-15889]
MSTAPFNTQTVATSAAPKYPFLSQPPPQKKRPTQPLPSPPAQAPASPRSPVTGRRRSATTSAIAAWIVNVQPGSPAPPTPRRRTSISSSRRPSISPRSCSQRPSVGSGRVPSASFLNVSESPTNLIHVTPSLKDFQPDLTAVGYASVFVHFPKTPSSAAYPDRHPSPLVLPISPAPLTPEKPAKRGLKHFRSLSVLKRSRSRSKSTTMPSMPSPSFITRHAAPPIPPTPAHSRAQSRDDVNKSKKSKYAKYRPPPLATELALAQLADGGKMDDHVRRFAEAQARAGGAQMVNGTLVGVGDVWRDGAGGIWRDQDEEWEYAHLLGGDQDLSSEAGWVRFGSASAASPSQDEERRGSCSSQDSDLDPRYAMQADSGDDLAVFGSAVMPSAMRKPGMSVLALPSRTRRAAPHLRKPEFLLDVFPVPDAPTPHAGKQPLSPHVSNTPQSRPAGKERRRPAPLALAPPSPAAKYPANPIDDVRRDFLDHSFTPAPVPKVRDENRRHHQQHPSELVHSPARVESRSAVARKIAANGKGSLNMRGLLKVMGGKKDI